MRQEVFTKIVWAVAFLFVGCSEDINNTSLVRIDSELPSANCPAGGISVVAGLDENGDGILQDIEIDSQSFVCNGQNGTETLFLTTNEPPSINCAQGGVRVSAGQDDNNNGQLDTNEIDSETFVCNGEGGQPFPLGPVLEGSFTIENDFDALLLQNVVEITGDLNTTGSGFDTLSLPNLTTVGGRLVVDAEDLTTLNLPSLQTSQSLEVICPSLDSLDISSLTDCETIEIVGSSLINIDLSKIINTDKLNLLDNSNLTSIELTNLSSANNVVIQGNNLSEVNLPNLQSGNIFVAENAIQSLSLPTLQQGGVDARGDLLTSLDLPSLVSAPTLVLIGSGIDFVNAPLLNNINNFSILGMLSMTSILLPSLTEVGILDIQSNQQLSSLDFPNLDIISNQLNIRNNPLLPTCQTQNLVAQLSVVPTFISIIGNDDAGGCP